MEPSRWDRITRLYQAASELDAGERIAFLADAAKGDEELRREVESLLAQDVTQDGVLERVAREAASLVSAAGRRMPAAIGRYRILKIVGEGGMGLVYQAEQDHPRRIVALKVLKAALPDAEAVRRFDRESDALGRLQHPGIARIYEAGTAETELGPQPYLAMEFIRGASIIDYAEARHLGTRPRLEMMAGVADAVHHAHLRGIVHRDLKPGNILVDEAGQPKILDFGVARIADAEIDGTGQTGPGDLIGTLAYMSPEQVLGNPLEVDARSDIYSLGVILYELMAGCAPYQVARTVYEAARTIREETPALLGHIRREYQGDLEAIAAKALEKEKAQRYASAAELATDIRHYLRSEPILARRPSAIYQARKFAVRHRGLVGAVLVTFAALTVGLLVSMSEAVRANRAERAALTERDRAAAAERNARAERDRALRAENADKAERQRAEQERSRAVAESQRADTEAATARAVNDFLQNDLLAKAAAQGQSSPDTKPDPDLKVRAVLDRAAASLAVKHGFSPAVEAAIWDTIGTAYANLGLFPEAELQMQRALALRRRVLGPGHKDTLRTMVSLARLNIEEGHYAPAETLYIEVSRQNRGQAADAQVEIDAMTGLAQVYAARGDYGQSAALLAQSVAAQKKTLGERHPAVLAAMSELGDQYANQGKFAQAADLHGRVLALRQQTLGAEHPDTLESMETLAMDFRQSGDFARAEELFVQVLNIQRRVQGESHPDTLLTMKSLGRLYYSERKYAQAEPLLAGSWEGRRRVLGEDHPDTLQSMSNLAALYWRQGRLDQAETLFRRALEAERRVLGPHHPSTVGELLSLAGMKVEQREYATAEPLLREALQGLENTSRPWMQDYTRGMLGSSLAGLGRYEEAEPLLLSSYDAILRSLDSIPSENRNIVDRIRNWIAEMYQSWGKADKAAQWRERVSKR